MKLYELLNGIAKTSLENIEITHISCDTRDDIKEGTLFVCFKRLNFDPHDSLPAMADKGVSVFITERDMGLKNQIVVPDGRLAYSQVWANWYGNPEQRMKFIGVTGTNGKTTTTTVIKRQLDSFGIKAGLIGTCQNEIGERVLHAERTTPEPDEFFKLLKDMADDGCEYVVMEVSSQGLSQQRLGNVIFDVAVFTNLTQDHLDVHGSMENYYQAKKLMFDRCKKALVNIDDEGGRRLFNEISCEKYSFSICDAADFTADGIKLSAGGSEYWYSNSQKTFKVSIMLPGSYNVSNTVAAMASLELAGFNANLIAKEIKNIHGVRGRCEVVPTGRDFTVVLDYAHTPDALVNILKNVRECSQGRIVCLFGCGGNRDAKKRPLMAKAAQSMADFLIITSDNPRDENPHEIIKEILTGLSPDFKEYIEIDDRRQAIHWSIKNAKPGDVIVLAGKGHEDYQILFGGVKIHFDEREIVNEALNDFKE